MGDQAQAHFRTAMDLGAHLFEPAFNAGLLAFKLGEFQDSAELAQKALDAYPEHFESKELCSEATKACDYKDWWWKARLGKCYFQMGMYRDAEKQFKSAIKEEDTVGVQLELAKCLTRLDQP